MPVYSFYIFDRHTECVYAKRWQPSIHARPQSNNVPPPTTNGTGTNVRRVRDQRTKDADDAKLIFGAIFSLRNMVRRLGGDDDEFISYNTGEYKLHYYETPTNLKFVMLTDKTINNLRVVLHQIWANLWVQYVVLNPMSPAEHPGGVGVNNELFEMGLDRFVTQVFNPPT